MSLYTWTKGVAAGALLVPVALAVFGALSWSSVLVGIVGPSVGLGFLGLTGALLVWDLKHPLRLYLIFTEHQWKSWLVRGAVILGIFGLVLVAELVAGIASAREAEQLLAGFGLVTALMAAVYTAYLFAQAAGATSGRARC